MTNSPARGGGDGYDLSRYVLHLGGHWYWDARTAALVQVPEPIRQLLNHPKKRRLTLQPSQLDELRSAGMLVNADADEVAEVVRETQEAVENAPLVYRVFTTTGCNASCPYCYEHGIAIQDMDDETADAVARHIMVTFGSRSTYEPVGIEWFGGEPLLNPRAISRICERLHDACVPFRSFVFTNGILLDKVPIVTMRELWNTAGLQVTLDGAPGEYEAIKGAPQGTFEWVLTSVEHLLEDGLDVVLRINYDGDTGRAVRLADALVERFRDAPPHARPKIDVVPLYAPGKEIPAETMHAVLDIYDYLISLGMVDVEKVYSLKPRRYGCFMSSCGGYTVMPDGSLINCSHLAGAKERVGDVFHPGQVDAARDTFIRRDFSPECRECHLLPICRGGCRVAELGLCEMHQCHPYKNVLRRVLLEMR